MLRTAGLHQAKGQAAEARALYTEILAAEPDWPEALHTALWFLADQGDIARFHTTLADAQRDYEQAHQMSQRLTEADPSNTGWQRDLWVSYWRLAYLAKQQKKDKEARGYWRKASEVLSVIESRGLHLSPQDQQTLEILRSKADPAL